MAPDELTCRELIELVTDYLEGALPTDDRERFDDHLATCWKCARYLDQMRRTIEAVGRLSEDAVPAPARDDLLLAFRGWRLR